MAETVVEKAVCAACDAEIRDESLFCYNCGTAVAPVVEPIAEPAEIAEPPVATKRPELRSAASLRKHRRAYNRQPIEISWEPRENSPTAFILATVLLTAAALLLLVLALYLR